MIDLSGDVDGALRRRKSGQRLKQGGFIFPGLIGSRRAPGAQDPYWSDVLLYSRFNGAAGSTSFTDLSRVARSLTPQNGAQVDANGLFNQSANLDSTRYIDAGTATDLALGANNFAIELAFYFKTLPASGVINTLLNKSTPGNHGWELVVENVSGAMRLYFGYSTNGTTLTYYSGVLSLSTSVWTRVAVVRSGSTLYFFQNGTRLATGVIGGTIWPSTIALKLAGTSFGSQGVANGLMDELRITKNDRGMTGTTYTLATTEFPTS